MTLHVWEFEFQELEYAQQLENGLWLVINTLSTKDL